MTTAAAAPLLALSGIGKTYGGVRALVDIDFDIRAGEVHCLVGENGSGKSTLIKIISGAAEPDRGGHLTLNGVERASHAPADAKAAGIEVIYQDLSLFPNLTVRENIGFPLMSGKPLRRVPRRAIRSAVDAAVSRLAFELPLDSLVADLPIGARQLVAICRSMVSDARLLIMDEPTASLSRSEVEQLIAVVRKLKSEGVAIMFVSHKLDEVTAIAERVTVLRDGRKVGTFPAAELDDRRIEHLMLGRSITRRLRQRTGSAERVLEIEGLTRAGEFEDVSLELRRGESVGIIGLLGAGRTELALAVAGTVRPDRGRILLRGRPAHFRSNRDAIRSGIAYLSEDRLGLGLHLTQPIELNTVISVLPRLGRLGIVPPPVRRHEAGRWVERLKIKIPGLRAAVSTLSGGNQQRVALAKWLATRPDILILDSPTVGVDIGNKEGIYAIVETLRAEGMAILVISDEVGELFAVCDRILHMRSGRLVGSFDPAVASEDEVKEAVYG